MINLFDKFSTIKIYLLAIHNGDFSWAGLPFLLKWMK